LDQEKSNADCVRQETEGQLFDLIFVQACHAPATSI